MRFEDMNPDTVYVDSLGRDYSRDDELRAMGYDNAKKRGVLEEYKAKFIFKTESSFCVFKL